jgi:hypothetical protein
MFYTDAGGKRADAAIHEKILAGVPGADDAAAIAAYKHFRAKLPHLSPEEVAEAAGVTAAQAAQAEKELTA